LSASCFPRNHTVNSPSANGANDMLQEMYNTTGHAD
jgi:hypothetical protein